MIAILICGSRSEHIVRYSLGTTNSPLAVASYTYEKVPAGERGTADGGRVVRALDRAD